MSLLEGQVAALRRRAAELEGRLEGAMDQPDIRRLIALVVTGTAATIEQAVQGALDRHATYGYAVRHVAMAGATDGYAVTNIYAGHPLPPLT